MDYKIGLGHLLVNRHLGLEDVFGFLVADFISFCETFNLLIGGDINHEDLVDKVGQIDLKEEWDDHLDNSVRVLFSHFFNLTDKRLNNARVCNPF